MKFLRALGKNPVRGCLPEILLIMRLTTVFILLASLHVSARGGAQGKISLTLKDAPLEVAFKAVLKQSGGYNFVGKTELLKSGKSVSLSLKDASLIEALDECFRGQPLMYEVKDKIIIVELIEVHPTPVKVTPPGKGVNGNIADEDGSSIAGATITVKGTNQVIVADSKGHFMLDNIDPNAVLVISCVGYETKEIPVSGRLAIRISLNRKSGPLDEIQVIAYGTTTQRLSVGNVASVKSEDIEKQPVSNPILALEGRVPGLFITQNTGVPGGGVTVRVQGQNSFSNGNDPLYVVDGVPFTSQLSSPLGGSILNSSGGAGGINSSGVGSPLSFINPSDIESIEVLKDADATAIYGSRAANGAILITTKKGKSGATSINFNIQQGMGQVDRMAKMLNTKQYLAMRHEALDNDGLTPQPTDYDLTLWDTTRYTDWQKTLIGNTSKYTNITGSASGGTAATQYLLSGTYHRETTVFPGDFSDQKASVHFILNSASSNQRFHIQFSTNYTNDNNHLPAGDFTQMAYLTEPDAPKLYNPNGTLNWAPNASGSSTWTNPLASLNLKYSNATNNLITNALLSYQILPGLDIRSSFGYTITQSDEYQQISTPTSVKPEYQQFTTREAGYGNRNLNTWIIEPQLHYNNVLGRGKFDLLIGSTLEQNNSKGEYEAGVGYNSDQAMGDLNSAATIYPANSYIIQYKYAAIFGRINYNWNSKYIIDVTTRRDGSSRFGPENEYHNFASAGGAWIFTQEKFIARNIPFLSLGKIRVSYGTTGSDQIGDYTFLNLYHPTYAAVPYQNVSGLTTYGIPNPYLQWEETKKIQFGTDLGMLKDRILLNITYQRNRSSNELLPYNLPSITGATSITTNFPATIQNTSVEIGLNAFIFKMTNFSWNVRINVTVPRNKVTAFPDLATSSYASYYTIGQPVSLLKLYHFLGVDPTTGQYEFSSKSGPTPNPTYGLDNTVNLTTLPKYYGGLENSFRYKGFQLDVLFQFVKQIGLNYSVYSGQIFPGQFYSGFSNQPTSVLNRWQKPGDNAAVAEYSTNPNSEIYNVVSSDYLYRNASYIRLRNLSLSWLLPNKWRQAAHLSNAVIYFQGQNLLTITKYIGLDPENQGFSSLPPLRVLTMGVKIGL